MAQDKKTLEKSFRALVGVASNGQSAAASRGVYMLDSNDTAKYYAFFAVVTGLSPEDERKCLAKLEKKFEPYADTYKSGDIGNPKDFIKRLVSEVVNSMISSGVISRESSDFGIGAAMVLKGTLYTARVNAFPFFILKDRKFRHIFHKPKNSGADSLQIATEQLGDGDLVVAGSKDVLGNITELELRSILLSEEDLSLACSKISIQASKNTKQTLDPRLMALRFKRNYSGNKKLFTKRNVAVMGALAAIILVFFMWGEIARYVRTGPMAFIAGKKDSVVKKVIDKVTMPKAMTLEPELVFDGLSVPYDMTIDEDGVLYVVDDREEKIVKYDPRTGTTEKIGTGVELTFPTGIDLMGNRLYVADFSKRVSKVYIFTTNGDYIGTAPDKESSSVSLMERPMQNPKAVESLDGESSIYVCDRGNNRLLKFSMNGTYESKIEMPSSFKEPNGMAITDSGVIFLTLKRTGIVATITSRDSVSEFTIYRDVNGETEKVSLGKPSGIAVDKKGNVYIADTANQRVVVADNLGKLIAVIDGEKIDELRTHYPMSVKLGPRGEYVYIVASNRYSYDVTCQNNCSGKIWKIKI